MSVAKKINKETTLSKKKDYWLPIQFINHSDIHGVMTLG